MSYKEKERDTRVRQILYSHVDPIHVISEYLRKDGSYRIRLDSNANKDIIVELRKRLEEKGYSTEVKLSPSHSFRGRTRRHNQVKVQVSSSKLRSSHNTVLLSVKAPNLPYDPPKLPDPTGKPTKKRGRK